MSPTIKPHEKFNVLSDVETLNVAMKGLGTDEDAIISVLSRRSLQQRIKITSKYKDFINKDLIEVLKSELTGNFEVLVVSMMTPLTEYLARELHRSMKGLGTKEDTLTEILVATDKKMLQDIATYYQAEYKSNLQMDIKDDTSGVYQQFLIALTDAKLKSEIPSEDQKEETIDMTKVTADAHALYKAGEKRVGVDEDVFIFLFVSRSLAHLRQVFMEYEKITKNCIEIAIKNEFKGDIKDALLAFVGYVNGVPEFFATRLYKSMKGLGTRDHSLIRLVTWRSEIDMVEVKAAFLKKYHKTLQSFIEGDTSGDYKKMLLAMIDA